jgi:thimet oligopeptidase
MIENKCAKAIADIAGYFPQTIAEAEALVVRCVSEAKVRKEQLLSLSDEQRTFDNTVRAYDRMSKGISVVSGILETLSLVHSDVQNRSNPSRNLKEATIELFSDVAFYQAFLGYAKGRYAQEKSGLTQEECYFFEKELREFERKGYALSPEDFASLSVLLKKEAQAAASFDMTIYAVTPTLEVEESELAGVDPAFVAGCDRTDSGKVVLAYSYPMMDAVMKYCTNASLRKQVWEMDNARGYPENNAHLAELFSVRRSIAQMLGYHSYAAYSLEPAMVRKPARVASFITALEHAVRPVFNQEVEAVMAHAPEDVVITDGKLLPWDVARARTHYENQKCGMDARAIAEYFPIDYALKGMLSIYEEFFNIKLEATESPLKDLWSSDVKGITVYSPDGNNVYGHIALDLHPRPGKYSHACCSPVLAGGVNDAGEIQPALAVLITNFPHLLTHRDVVTFFHEFGHAVHWVLNRTSVYSNNAFACEMDYIELPSQILEEWMYEPEMLKRVSSHHATGEHIPDAMIDQINMVRALDKGFFVMRQVGLSRASLVFHEEEVAASELQPKFQSLVQSAMPQVAYEKALVTMYASFGHLSGYAASYYGYLYSRSYAYDVFLKIKEGGLLNPAVGKQYAEKMLIPGGGRPALSMLTDFLGREPSLEAFKKYLQSE